MPHNSPTFGLGVEQVEELVWKTKPKASVECGVLKNLYKLEDGHTTEEHYKNVVLLIDNKDLDEWIEYYNNERTHQGKMCCGRTPLETLLDGKRIWAEKNLAQI